MNREERLLAYLEGACSGRDYRVVSIYNASATVNKKSDSKRERQ